MFSVRNLWTYITLMVLSGMLKQLLTLKVPKRKIFELYGKFFNFANSVDPDVAAQYEQSHLNLHCLLLCL